MKLSSTNHRSARGRLSLETLEDRVVLSSYASGGILYVLKKVGN